ncbi:MAG: hypothetical protein EBR86_13880, partial [Planctomycetia bacterium]|nr:hypothetical protein [Planctomycetia bacterium]
MTKRHAACWRGMAVLIGVCLLAGAAAAGEMRTWRDATGSFSREAEMLRVDGDSVVLRLKEGREIRVPLAKLSAADREYVKRVTAEPASPPAKESRESEPTAETQVKPFVRLTIRSYMALLDNTSYLADVLQQPLLAVAVPGAFAAATGGKTLDGFDVKRPIVAVVPVADGKPQEMVVFLPVKNGKQFRDTVGRIYPDMRQADGHDQIAIPGIPLPLVVRFDAEHAVV